MKCENHSEVCLCDNWHKLTIYISIPEHFGQVNQILKLNIVQSGSAQPFIKADRKAHQGHVRFSLFM